ncbi:MAG: hypothetical protein AAB392_01095 [Patescibacteria group bacterium]
MVKTKIQKVLNKRELAIVHRLSTPQKVQDFLDKIPFNFELEGETYFSPRKVLRSKVAHCFEGALLAHLCLTYHGFQSFLLDLKVKKSAYKDQDHTLCIFKQNDFWGAISKTNHSVLRWRDPIYKDYKELAKSYFHEYFLENGEKTLWSFSKPFDVFKILGTSWLVQEDDLDDIAKKLDRYPHLRFVPAKNYKSIRKAGKTEIKGAGVAEWHKKK